LALKVWLIIATVVYGLLLLPTALMLMFSPMMFDAPGSTENPVIWILLFTIMTYPPVAATSVFFAWRMYQIKKHKIAFALSLLPLISIVVGTIDAQLWR
jgi:hypothetical protein